MTYEIRTLEPGEKITEPGFYDITLDVHHSQCCDGFSVTSGGLRRVQIKTPGDFWAFHDNNPSKWESEETDALRMGRAMAAFVEGGKEEVDASFYVLPDYKPNRPSAQQLHAIKKGTGSKTANSALAFWKEVDSDPRDKITDAQYRMIVEMGGALVNDPMAQAVLSGIPEVTMAWKDEATGIWCLSRPDQVAFSGFTADYKKISAQGGVFDERVCDRAIEAHRYDMQMAFAGEGFEVLTGSKPDNVGLLFQSDKRPHFCIARGLDDEDLAIGRFHNHRSLRRISECLETGYWAPPGENPGNFKRSEAKRLMYLEEMQIEGKAP